MWNTVQGILSSPHGGSLEPLEIPDRDCTGCSYLKDSWTKTITEGVYDAIFNATGCYPHMIVNLLHRKKFDANRDIGDAADCNATVEQSWNNYHTFIDAAKAQLVTDYSKGVFLDMHGHAHTIQRIELGYLLTAAELRLPVATLNETAYVNSSSIKTLANSSIQSLSHAALLRGSDSFGTLLVNEGFPSVPSKTDLFPLEGESYFSGGYNTTRHGSRDNGGTIDAIQLEFNSDIRFDATSRAQLIESVAEVAIEYIDLHYNNQFAGNFCSLVLSNADHVIKNFKIYPNPASKFITIESDLNPIDVEIYNLKGKLYSDTWSGKDIDISFLANGLYILQLKKDNVLLASTKFIKE